MKLFKINFLILFFISSFLTIANAGTGPASVYKIQIYKIEVCDNTSTATECENAVAIYDSTAGSGDIDIGIFFSTLLWAELPNVVWSMDSTMIAIIYSNNYNNNKNNY